MTREVVKAEERAQRLAEAAGQGMHGRDRASQALGIRLLDIGPGHARMRMTVRPDMANGHRTCHGGLIFTLADTAFALACNSHNRNAVAQQCSVTFLKPAQVGEVLIAEAAEQALGGRSGVYDVKVSNEKGELVALFRGNSRVIAGEVVPEPPPPHGETGKEPS